MRQCPSRLAAAVAVAVLGVPAVAHPAEAGLQDLPPVVETPAAASENQPRIPLEVVVTLSRYRDDKELSRMPYAMGVTANDNQGTSLRMELDVPTISTASGAPSGSAPLVSYQPVGVSMDCFARSEGPRFLVRISVDSDSLHRGNDAVSGEPTPASPIIRHVRTANTLLLADGESREFTAATDPVTGEVVRISVSLRVVK
jgi:hypothetical protein